MKIRTQFILTIFIFGFMLIAISASVIATNIQMQKATDQEAIAFGIAQGAGELNYLANDYMIHQESQQLERWNSRFSSFSDEVARLQTNTPEQQALVGQIQANSLRIKDVFESVVSALEISLLEQQGALDPSVLKVSWSRMAVQSQGLVSDASRLSQLFGSRVHNLQRINNVAVITLVSVFSIYFFLNYLTTQRRALKGLKRLQDGTAVIGSGNLDFKIEEKSDDEIGNLSRAFNLMTFNLKTVTASKAVLEREIEERKKAEDALRQSEEKYRTLFNSMSEGFAVHEIILDASGKPCDYRFLELNDAFERLTGLSREKVVGKNIREVMPDVESLWIENYGNVAVTGKPIHFENYSAVLGKWYGAYAYSPAKNRFAVLFADITERKKAEEALRETRDYLENLLNYANAPIIVWDPAYRIRQFNHAFEKLTERSADEVIGKQLDILFPQDSREESMNYIHKAVSGERLEAVEIPIQQANGFVRTVLWNSATLYAADGKTVEATIAQGQDITERKKAEEALRKVNEELERRVRERTQDVSNERQRLYDVLETLPAYVVLLDKDYHVPFANKFFRERFGESQGKRCYEYLFNRTESCENCESYKVMKTNAPHHWEWLGPDGRNYDIFDSPFMDTDGSPKIMEMGIDITEQKQAQKALFKAHEELELKVRERTAELEAANKELEAFSYSVSHDLRAPLRSMEGFSNAILDDYGSKLDDQGRLYLRYVQESSQLMAQLIDDLLELSRVTRSDMNYEDVDLSELAVVVSDQLLKSEPNKKVNMNISPGIMAYGDRNLLRIVLENLLGNAWKFTSKSASPRVEMGITTQNDKSVYYVRDNGVGFDMAYADKLFKPFQRLHKETEFEGTGIGLATVQRIVRRHGGEVWADSKVGGGATFYFTLEQWLVVRDE